MPVDIIKSTYEGIKTFPEQLKRGDISPGLMSLLMIEGGVKGFKSLLKKPTPEVPLDTASAGGCKSVKPVGKLKVNVKSTEGAVPINRQSKAVVSPEVEAVHKEVAARLSPDARRRVLRELRLHIEHEQNPQVTQERMKPNLKEVGRN